MVEGSMGADFALAAFLSVFVVSDAVAGAAWARQMLDTTLSNTARANNLNFMIFKVLSSRTDFELSEACDIGSATGWNYTEGEGGTTDETLA